MCSFPGSQDPSRPLSTHEATLYSTILDHPAQRTSASQHNAKNNKYLRVCVPSTNLYTFFTSILSVGLQNALSDAILTHSLSLCHPPPSLVTVSDSDIATAHIYT